MAREEQISDGPSSDTMRPADIPGDAPPLELEPMWCAELDWWLGYYLERLADAYDRLADTPKWRFRVVNQVRAGSPSSTTCSRT